MRNTCLRLHPPEYDPVSNEQFYQSMAKQGWILERRGRWFSRFRREAPRELRFHAAYACDPHGFSASFPSERLFRCRDAGWELAGFQGTLYLFSSPAAGSPFPLPPEDRGGETQAMYRAANRGLTGFAAMILWSVAVTLFYQFSWSHLTPVQLILLLPPIYLLLVLLPQQVGFRRLYRTMRDGLPRTQWKTVHYRARWAAAWVLLAVMVAIAVLLFRIELS